MEKKLMTFDDISKKFKHQFFWLIVFENLAKNVSFL